jgi:hypothetical protein
MRNTIDLVERARRAYQRRCTEQGWIYQQPCRYESGVEGEHVVLRNVRGELARYEVTRAGGLRSNARE